MKVKDLIEKINFKVIATEKALDREIDGVIVGDLLSFVMGNGQDNNIWISVQGHLNVIAVALLKEFSCLILVGDIELEEEVLAKAKEENIAILRTELSAYEMCGTLKDIGI